MICGLSLAGVIVAGCGGAGSAATQAPSTTPRTGPAPATASGPEARYRARLGAICRDVDRRVGAVARPDDPRQLAGYLADVLSIGGPALRRLASVKPPPRLVARAREAIALGRREVRLVAEAADALEGSDDPARTYAPFQRRLNALLAREDAAWLRLGVPDCAEEGPPPAATSPPI